MRFSPLAGAAVILAVIFAVCPQRAEARQPPEPCDERATALVDTSSWVRVGGAWGEVKEAGTLASQTAPGTKPLEFGVGFATAFGADATIGLMSKSVRAGPWAEVAVTDFDTLVPAAGLELQVGSLPSKLGWFHYTGQGQFTMRAGAGRSIGSSLPESNVLVGAITWGYVAPWDLFGNRHHCYPPPRYLQRYMIGARLVASVTTSMDNPEFWMATVGLEIEPAGAIRYIFGIRDWY